MNKQLKILLWLLAGFLAAYFLPVDSLRFQGAVIEAMRLVRWYAQEHVLLCLAPAFFIAGATDPNKAQTGSVRREFGLDVMVNAAHASDSVENAEREIGIVKVDEDLITPWVRKYYGD